MKIYDQKEMVVYNTQTYYIAAIPIAHTSHVHMHVYMHVHMHAHIQFMHAHTQFTCAHIQHAHTYTTRMHTYTTSQTRIFIYNSHTLRTYTI